MIAASPEKTQVLIESSVHKKLAGLDHALHQALGINPVIQIPVHPGRDVQILRLKDLPNKEGLSTKAGQARLMHDLASIELQAMELGLRTLIEFPEAPREFREQLVEVTREEGKHLAACLRALDSLGMPWGTFPTHDMLWCATSEEDSILDRILIVHRYLEGSGLDASEKIVRRLSGVQTTKAVSEAIHAICRDELDHVCFGSHWYHEILKSFDADPAEDMKQRLLKVQHRLPRRLELIDSDLRRKAGFTNEEIEILREFQSRSV